MNESIEHRFSHDPIVRSFVYYMVKIAETLDLTSQEITECAKLAGTIIENKKASISG